MAGAIDKLFFTIGLIDRVSGPGKGVTGTLAKIQAHARGGFTDVALGAGSIYGSIKAMEMFTGPAGEFNRALGEVASLDVPTDELDRLGSAAKKFTMKFGGDAASVVASAYDIQSAIPGLAKGALAAFSYQGALLAKAGKSNSATITKYMGTMYNIFEEDAKKVGQAQWVEQLTGKTAYAIKMFKTTGDEMSAAFTNVGSVGKSAGVRMDEQMAVLGTLQGTMGGANAGTAYAGFLNKVIPAQKELGLSFVDSQGKMLPMIDILGKIRQQVGPGELKAADSAKIMSAFGEVGGKAVLNLLNKTEQLKGSITDLGKIDGSSGALKMAEAMTDPTERFGAIIKVVKTTIGQSLLPVINIVLMVISRVLIAFEWLLEAFPPLRWAIVAAILAVTAFSTAWGVLKIAMGLGSIWSAVTLKIRLMNAALYRAHIITGYMTVSQKAAAVASYIWTAGIWGSCTAAWAATVSFVAGLVPAIIAGATAMWAFAAALWATGIPEIIVVIALLVGAIIAVVYWWDEITGAVVWAGKAIGDFFVSIWGWFKSVCPNIAGLIEKLASIWWNNIILPFTIAKAVFIAVFSVLGSLFGWIGGVAVSCWEGMTGGLQTAIDWLSDKLVPVVQFVGTLFEWLGGLGSMVWEGLKSALSSVDGWIGNILRTLAKIPGLGGLSPDISVNQAQTVKPVVSEVAEARKSTVRDVGAGGINQRINNNSTNWGGVTINTSSSLSPGDLEEWAMLQAW